MDTMTLAQARSVIGRHNASLRSKLSRQTASKYGAAKAWITRRARYGPTGCRPVQARLRAKLEAVGWYDDDVSVKLT